MLTRSALPAAAIFLSCSMVFAVSNPDIKIESKLLNRLADDVNATAPFYIVFTQKADLSPARNLATKPQKGRFVGQALQRVAANSQAGVKALLKDKRVEFTPFWIENKIAVPKGTLALARELADRPEVLAIVPVPVYKVPTPKAAPSAALAYTWWNLSLIGADQVWPQSRGGGAVVANIDTGVQYNHSALVRQYRGNNGNGTFTHEGNWYDPTGVSPDFPADGQGHGSHTMGTMVGDDGGSNLVGVAPSAKWMACRWCSGGSCPGTTVMNCAQWLLDPHFDGSFRDQPDVVNNSWGGFGGTDWFEYFIENWRAAGIFPAFIIGNDGPKCSTADSPGDNAAAFGVGGTDAYDVIGDFSGRGPSLVPGVGIKPNVVAPAVGIYSTIPDNTYAFYTGTSTASPHVAGAVALLWSAAPSLRGNVDATEQLLETTSVHYGTTEDCGGTANQTPNNTYGHGRIDVRAALNAASGPINQPPVVTITSPADGAQINCGVPVQFTGTAVDPEEGTLTNKLQWADSSTGVAIGNGGSITTTFACPLTINEYHTVATGTSDKTGAQSSKSITVNVVNQAVPIAPTNLKITASGRVATFTWTWSGTSPLTGFRLEYKPLLSTTWTAITPLISPSARTTTWTAPTTGTFQWRLIALNNSLVSPPSNVVSYLFLR